MQRAVCERVQQELGSAQIARYGVSVSEAKIGGVPVRIFDPPERSSSGAILLNLHGGGFSKDAGSITENVPVAALTGMRVVAARYRLSPEHPYPAPVDDAQAVYEALLAEDGSRPIGLYGTSAGAILCIQLLVRIQELGLRSPKAHGFFSGSADLSRHGDTEQLFRPVLDGSRSGPLFAEYVGEADVRQPRLSPLFADLSQFPPTLCLAGTRDFMLSQTAIFHRALIAAGVESQLIVFEAMLHAHWIYLDIPESDEAFSHMAKFFRSHSA
ncbi:MAG TPA: alpha/beta hydrolase fold domain-containing protein [Nitrospira sp.]|nr:alpha/beta hydrolase fold domain-containing protein [Nitrospira sp.]